MIITLTIQLDCGTYAGEDWSATIEIDSTFSLEDLHLVIQDVAGFDNDHLYQFYVARTERSHMREIYDCDEEEIYTTTLASLYPLPKSNKLYYLFDFGDSWLFTISKSRKKPFEPVEGIEYPRIIKEVGKKPEQYPGWDE